MPRIAGIHSSGRYFVDVSGAPILVRGDAPWSAIGDLTTAQMTTFLEARAGQGYNLMILSAVCGPGNGGPNNNGNTFDGVSPFSDTSLTLNETYWTRVDHWMAECARLGITTLLFPTDGWTVRWGGRFEHATNTAVRAYAQTVAERYDGAPVLWAGGGDYTPDNGALDAKFVATLDGIRDSGDTRPYVMQTFPPSNPPSIGHSYETALWRTRSDWDFIYTYGTSWPEVLTSRSEPNWSPKPALLSEFRYLREYSENDGLQYRRQHAWALTCGSPGVIWGTQDWQFLEGWEQRLSDPIIDQITVIFDAVKDLRWWTLTPDPRAITTGVGTPLPTGNDVHPGSNDRATAAHDDQGNTLVYLPSGRELTLAGTPISATWIDPVNGERSPIEEPTSGMATPGQNSGGDSDWLLLVRNEGPFRSDGRSVKIRRA